MYDADSLITSLPLLNVKAVEFRTQGFTYTVMKAKFQ